MPGLYSSETHHTKMMVGLMKKKNIIVITLCMVTCFILYQLYFFVAITSEAAKMSRFIAVLDSRSLEQVHLRSEADKFISDNGVIRGVPQQHMPRYRPDSKNEFKCLKSEQSIPFSRMNDDYCDCEDGTDEPSTSACHSGVFYCDIPQKKPATTHTVPSSRVNDGICDCCDGSDEWIHSNKKLLTQASLTLFRYYTYKCPNVC